MRRKDEKDTSFKNPIDPDKVAENPGLLPYAHQVGSAVIRPEDQGRIKGTALKAMYQQTDVQLNQIKEQIALLAQQANAVHERIIFSEKIYLAKIRFKPVLNTIYHLYESKKGEPTLSMIGPTEWGKSKPHQYLASVRLLADHTWEKVKN